MKNSKLIVNIMAFVCMTGLSQAALLTHWEFDQTNGTAVLYDTAPGGSAANGAFTGSGSVFVPSAAGVAGSGVGFGTAGEYGTTTEYILYDDPADFDLGTSDFTITGWIKQSEIPSTQGIYYEILNNNVSGGGFVLMLGKGNSSSAGKLYFQINGAETTQILSDNRLDDGTWHWYAATLESGVMYMYIDGVLQTASASLLAGSTATGTGTARMAYNISSQLDDMRIYNTALTKVLSGNTLASGELYDVWQYGNDPVIPALVAYWDMNETNGSPAVIDKAGYSDGPLIAGAQFVPSNAGVGAADLGNMLALPGGTTPVFYSAETRFNFGTNDFTVTGWIQIDDVGSSATTRPEVFMHGDAGGGLYIQVGKPSTSTERGKMKIQVDDVALLSDARIDDSIMHWYAMVVSNGTINMYIDGVKQAGSATYLPTTSATPTTGTAAHQGRYFTGLLDDMRFYNTALTGTLYGNTLSGGELYDVWQFGTAEAPATPATIVDWSFSSSNVLRMVVDAPGAASRYHPESVADLVAGVPTAVAHSTNGLPPFTVTNLTYSVAEGTNEVIYVQADDAVEFFKIIGE